jgi:hypothetical protein
MAHVSLLSHLFLGSRLRQLLALSMPTKAVRYLAIEHLYRVPRSLKSTMHELIVACRSTGCDASGESLVQGFCNGG